jgi:hypothetical protein
LVAKNRASEHADDVEEAFKVHRYANYLEQEQQKKRRKRMRHLFIVKKQ